MNILTKMYQGSYVLRKDRIGHEFINLIQSDNGKYYIWLNSNGNFNYGGDNHTVLMVKTLSNGLYKILGKAIGCKPVNGCNSQEIKNAKTRYKTQIKEQIFYNKIGLEKIHSKEINTFVTFEAEKVMRAHNKMYITTDDALVDDKNFFKLDIRCKSSMREYFDKTRKRRKQFTKIIENENIWQDELISDDLNDFITENFTNKKNKDTMYSILSKEEDEICISNSIAYFLNKYDYQKDFLREIGVKHLKSSEIELYRELNDIDLFFRCGNKIVVIENKINAGITIKQNDTFSNQLKTALKNPEIVQEIEEAKINTDYVKKDIYKRCHPISKFKIATQLSKYVIIANIYACCYGIKKENVLFYLLLPNYNKTLYVSKNGKLKRKFLFAKKYKITNYDLLYKIFKTLGEHKKDKYLNDFISTLNKIKENNDYDYEISLASNLYRIIHSNT